MRPKLHAEQEANYQFYPPPEPAHPMGQGEFANMPTKPMISTFSRQHEHRDGIINSFTTNVEFISDIAENQKW